MHIVLLLLILNFCFCTTDAQLKPIEKTWVKEDSIFINKVIQAYKNDPLSVEFLLSYKKNKKEKLGFGYYSVSGSNGKGYVSLFYQLIYFNEHLISYKIDPQLPKDTRLLKRYAKFYSPLFKINKYDQIEPLYLDIGDMAEPLKNANHITLTDNQIAYYMTPYSGTMYGDFGGWGSTLANRAYYLSIKNKITPAICELLLYSKNPATRFTAIEFYYQNIKRFTNRKESIEKRIKEIFNEMPVLYTIAADEEITANSKELVQKLSAKKEKSN